MRAATPSHAAEIATPNMSEIIYKLDSFYSRAKEAIFDKINGLREEINDLSKSRCLRNPLQMLDIPTLRLSSLADKLGACMLSRVFDVRERFINANSKLVALNPMSVLSRGYGAVLDENNKVIKSINDIELNDNVVVMLKDGKFSAVVQKKDRSKNDA